MSPIERPAAADDSSRGQAQVIEGKEEQCAALETPIVEIPMGCITLNCQILSLL